MLNGLETRTKNCQAGRGVLDNDNKSFDQDIAIPNAMCAYKPDTKCP